MLQHVFISYRHESPEHARTVRRLAELLRQAAIPVALDQFHLEEYPGGPDLGWPKWCEDCANQSACVLIIGSEGWFSAYEKTASPGLGLGAASEADLFRQALWDEQGNNTRIRLAFLHNLSIQQVPVRLRAWHQFRPFDNDDQLNQLIRWVASRLNMSDIELPTVRWPAPVASYTPDLADRIKHEWPAIVELLEGQSRHRILLYEGTSGVGKSVLVREAAAYCKLLGIPLGYVDFKGGGLDVAGILGQLDLDLGQYLPNFSREDAGNTRLLRRDLRAMRHPVLVIFDGYEDIAENKPVVDWLNQQFFPEVETTLGLAIIVVGQQVPRSIQTRWHSFARHFQLNPITEIEHWMPWVDQHYPNFREKGADLKTVVMFTQGNPLLVSNMCEAISKS